MTYSDKNQLGGSDVLSHLFNPTTNKQQPPSSSCLRRLLFKRFAPGFENYELDGGRTAVSQIIVLSVVRSFFLLLHFFYFSFFSINSFNFQYVCR